GRYPGDVLILHGDKDTIVPMSYSERAAKTYKSAAFHVIKDGAHGFQGPTFDQAIGFIEPFLRKSGVLK
ncbi:MAG: alpha/beta hydrolase, partial [Pyramidobacter sp.]|nr:alpha/beta hydrolase [Pyramidobacter sp.]